MKRTLLSALVLLLACNSPEGKAPPGGNTSGAIAELPAPTPATPNPSETPKPGTDPAATPGNNAPIPAPTTPEDPARKPTAQGTNPPPVVAARHVLIQYKGAERSEATRTKEEAKARAEQVLKLARSQGTDFGSLAKYSDEPAAEARGGSLGVFGRGQMTPKFEEVTFGLGEGQVSDVVETEFGFHVIQREPVYALAVIPVLFKSDKAPPSVTRTKEEAAARANEAVTKLRGGLVLSEAVKSYSDEPNANMGLVQVQLTSDSMLPPPVREKVTGVALNGIADPVEVPIGYFVIQKQPLVWADAAHILVRYKGALGAEEDATITRSKDDAKKLADQVLTEVKAAGADFGALAKKYSDDAGSKEKGGSLGTVFTGNDVSSIVDPVVVLKVGDISGVVETPFGFHIFKRLPAAPPAPPAPMVLPGIPGDPGTPPGHP